MKKTNLPSAYLVLWYSGQALFTSLAGFDDLRLAVNTRHQLITGAESDHGRLLTKITFSEQLRGLHVICVHPRGPAWFLKFNWDNKSDYIGIWSPKMMHQVSLAASQCVCLELYFRVTYKCFGRLL